LRVLADQHGLTEEDIQPVLASLEAAGRDLLDVYVSLGLYLEELPTPRREI
jgi:hypothetical protein